MKNKILTPGLFALCFMLSGFYAQGQDTIFYKKAASIVVIVKEVSQTEVQYKKIEMPDGPLYTINKSDIEKITYKNGYTEVIKDVALEPTNTASQPFTVTQSSPSSMELMKITYVDTKRRPKTVLNLIERHPNTQRKNELSASYSSMRKVKGGQDATRTVGIVFGGITIAAAAITTLIYSIDQNSGTTFAIVPVALGSVAIISTAASIAFNVNLRKKRHAFVDLYNQ